MTRGGGSRHAGLVFLAATTGPVAAQEAAVVDTARPFVAQAREEEQFLRGPVGWPTYQAGKADELFYRFDPDGYARFGPTERLDEDFWEVACTPHPVDCTARRGPVAVGVAPNGRPTLAVDSFGVETRFRLDREDGSGRTAAELSEPANTSDLLGAAALTAVRGGGAVPLDGLATVVAYMRWVEAGQPEDLRLDARPRRPVGETASAPVARQPVAAVPAPPAAGAPPPGGALGPPAIAEKDTVARDQQAPGAAAAVDPLSPPLTEGPDEPLPGGAVDDGSEAALAPVPSGAAPVAAALAHADPGDKMAPPGAATGMSGVQPARREAESPEAVAIPAAPASPEPAAPAAAGGAQPASRPAAVPDPVSPSQGASLGQPRSNPPPNGSPAGTAGGSKRPGAEPDPPASGPAALAQLARLPSSPAAPASSPPNPVGRLPLASPLPQTTSPAAAAAGCMPGALPPAPLLKPADSLRGLPGVQLVTDFLAEPDALRGKLRPAIRALAEERLKAAGIRLLDAAEVQRVSGKPTLEFYLTRGDVARGCPFRVWVSLRQEVALARDSSTHLITGTWGDGGASRADFSKGAEVATFAFYIDRFVKDWQTAKTSQPNAAAAKPPAGAATAPAPPPARSEAAAPGGQDATTRPESATTAAAASTGDDPDAVVGIQTALRDAGYDVGTIDGRLGQRTRATIRAFEHDHGLPVTGLASRRVLERLLARRAELPP